MNSQETHMILAALMNNFHTPTVSSNDNNAMLVRFSRQNLAEWKTEKASWENYGKKPTRKDKIAIRNKKIRVTQEKKEKEKEKGGNKKSIEECQVDWFDVF